MISWWGHKDAKERVANLQKNVWQGGIDFDAIALPEWNDLLHFSWLTRTDQRWIGSCTTTHNLQSLSYSKHNQHTEQCTTQIPIVDAMSSRSNIVALAAWWRALCILFVLSRVAKKIQTFGPLGTLFSKRSVIWSFRHTKAQFEHQVDFFMSSDFSF